MKLIFAVVYSLYDVLSDVLWDLGFLEILEEVTYEEDLPLPKWVYFRSRKTWEEARIHCADNGMWLATLDNKNDLNEARKVIAMSRFKL